MDIERFIRDLPWSDQATDHEKTLVEGNLRGLYSAMQDAVKPLYRAAVAVELAIDDENGDALQAYSEESPIKDDHPVTVTLPFGMYRALTKAINETHWAHEEMHSEWDRTKLERACP